MRSEPLRNGPVLSFVEYRWTSENTSKFTFVFWATWLKLCQMPFKQLAKSHRPTFQDIEKAFRVSEKISV